MKLPIQRKRPYDYEASKPISLRQVNLLALLQLKETGTCEFRLPEVLFDMAYPGHSMRRVKKWPFLTRILSGSLYQLELYAALTRHKFCINALVQGKNHYPEQSDQTDDRFSTINIAIASIAVSSGQNDRG